MVPDIINMTDKECEDYILDNCDPNNQNRDVSIGDLGQTYLSTYLDDLLNLGTPADTASNMRKQREPYTAKLYEAAWRLVLAGKLRPGPRDCTIQQHYTDWYCKV